MEHTHHKVFTSGAIVALMGVAIGITSTLAIGHLTAGIAATPQGHQGFRPVGQTDATNGRYAIRRRRAAKEEEDAPVYKQYNLDRVELYEAQRQDREKSEVESTPNDSYTATGYCTAYEYPDRGYCEALARQGIRFLDTEERRKLENSIAEEHQKLKQKTGDDMFYEWVRGRRVIKQWNGPTNFLKSDREAPAVDEDVHAAPSPAAEAEAQ